jgi:hypothetical protein
MKTDKKIIALVLTITVFIISACTQYHAQGAGGGALVGGLAGALIDKKNHWRGGVYGAGIGAIAGATLADISVRASQEAAQANQPVVYHSEQGNYSYQADPYYEPNVSTKCKKVRERIYENDRLVKDQVKEVCEGQRYDRTY